MSEVQDCGRHEISRRPNSVLATTVDRLGRDIVCGRRPPGSLLPVEAELCKTLGVGRNTLREAVKVLAGKGLLRTARRYGTRVCGREAWNLLDPELLGWLVDNAQFTRRLMIDLTEIRRAIEPFAAGLAAERARADEVEELLRAVDGLADPDVDTAIEADLRFHELIYTSTNNLALVQLGRVIMAMQAPYFRTSPTYWPNPEQHRKIARAVADRDSARAHKETTNLLEVNRAVAEKLSRDDHIDTDAAE
jgi:GntR family galactonate operon transcriptional repressor